MAGAVSLAIFAFDVISVRLEAFYTIFHGNEQKTPFLTLLCAAFLLMTSCDERNLFVIPAMYV